MKSCCAGPAEISQQIDFRHRLTDRHMCLNETEPGRRLVVLCVDDEADSLFLRAQIPERSGCTVIASTHPLLALEIICEQLIDAALLDYDMPQMNALNYLQGFGRRHRT
jgi:response regulator RpfG family c-di-GMP phosphodiesterase